MHPNGKSYKRARYLSFLSILIPALVYQNGGIRSWGRALAFCKGGGICVYLRGMFSARVKNTPV